MQARIRYKSPAADAIITPPDNLDLTPNTQATIQFATPVWGVTPGQSLVMYKDNLVVGGGIIQ